MVAPRVVILVEKSKEKHLPARPCLNTEQVNLEDHVYVPIARHNFFCVCIMLA